jgi:uncharacterized membrane protein
MKGGFRKWLRNTMLAGLFAILPLYLTFAALYLLFRWVDGFLSPVASPIIAGLLNALAGTHIARGTSIPGIGILATFLIILLAGLLVRNVVSRRLVGFFGRLLERIPLFGIILASAKQFLELFMRKRAFSQVAAVEYPLKGTWTVGFVTGGMAAGSSPRLEKPMTCFFVSTTPNPTTGFLLVVPPEDVVLLPMSVEEGIRVIVSAGILSPAGIPSSEND